LLALLAGSLFTPVNALAAAYRLPDNGDSVVGAVTRLKLRYEDTLAAVAERHGIGYREIIDANPDVDPWIPGEGTTIELPTQYVLPSAPRTGIVINVAEYRLYFYPKDQTRVITYPVGIGRSEFPTPVIEAVTVTRIENPSWTPTAAARREHAEMGDILPHVVPPGPDNPLGELAIQLSEPGYFIHGTNKPFGVGQKVSHGCIRLHNAHIATLAEIVPNGTPVYIVNEPIKVGVRYDEVYLEGHKDLYSDATDPESLKQVVEEKTRSRAASLDWQRVAQVLDDLKGVPVRI
jgi:L,D-transpeptidase ErfK/SrfK